MWSFKQMSYELQHPTPFVVPSWSRFSHGYSEGPGTSLSLGMQQECDQIYAEIQLVGLNRFGAMSSGKILLKTCCLDLGTLDRSQLTWNYFGPRHQLPGVRRHIDFQSRWEICVDSQALCCLLWEFDCISRDMGSHMEMSTLALLSSRPAKRIGDGDNWARGRCSLGLVLWTAPSTGTTYRIGSFWPPQSNVETLDLFRKLGSVKHVTIM